MVPVFAPLYTNSDILEDAFWHFRRLMNDWEVIVAQGSWVLGPGSLHCRSEGGNSGDLTQPQTCGKKCEEGFRPNPIKSPRPSAYTPVSVNCENKTG